MRIFITTRDWMHILGFFGRSIGKPQIVGDWWLRGLRRGVACSGRFIFDGHVASSDRYEFEDWSTEKVLP